MSLKFPIRLNDEVILHPRAYDNAVFEMISGNDNLAFRQNIIHGGQPIAQLYSPTKECTFYGDCSIPFLFITSHLSIHYLQTSIMIFILKQKLIQYFQI